MLGGGFALLERVGTGKTTALGRKALKEWVETGTTSIPPATLKKWLAVDWSKLKLV